MSEGFFTTLALAALAAAASPLGGAIAVWRKSSTVFMSSSLGFASGVLIGAITFEMTPKAIELGSLWHALGGFAAGLALVYGFDLYVHRGALVGALAEERAKVERIQRRRRPRGDKVTVLAGGTSVEEIIEGLSIGVGAAIAPGLGLVVALAIVVDNVSEGVAIGEFIRAEDGGTKGGAAARILGWTSVVGAAVLVSTLAGWFLLRDLPQPLLGLMFGAGAGGMFYLTVADLVPEAEARQYQQTAALAAAAGFLVMVALSTLAS